MENVIYKNISKNIENISDYDKEIEVTENFFYSKNVSESKLDEVFWNHIISLFVRVDTDSQNNMEMDELDEISKEAKDLLEEYIEEISKYRKFQINDFEKMLLTIYTQRMVQEV